MKNQFSRYSKDMVHSATFLQLTPFRIKFSAVARNVEKLQLSKKLGE